MLRKHLYVFSLIIGSSILELSIFWVDLVQKRMRFSMVYALTVDANIATVFVRSTEK